jgi:hypothetical protein
LQQRVLSDEEEPSLPLRETPERKL